MELMQRAYRWKNHIIAIGLLMAFAFFINRGIEIKGLYMDDLYLWSCYGEQTFMEYVFPIGGSRFRFLFYLISYLVLGLVGVHVNWLVPVNIALNGMIAATIYLMGRKLSRSGLAGFLAGVMYLLSRMSYYQISQVYGLMESVALWCAIGILYCLYQYLNSRKREGAYFITANLWYFAVCFIHERFMVLIPLFFLVLVMKRSREMKLWLLPVGEFLLIQVIRILTIGTISPAGTGGTDVADTFRIGESFRYALSQVAYVFGINAGPEHLNGLSWTDSPGRIKVLILVADLMLIALVVCFLIKIMRNKRRRGICLMNTILFLAFIALCIGSSSVTVRVELRWVYVSLAGALLFLCDMIGELTEGVGAEDKVRRSLPYVGLFACYLALMFPVETFYRSQFPNIYLWPNQLRYNSLADETYGRYGDEIFGKTIYIMGNSYEMSDFTAKTFFKVYDENRTALGTTVVFIRDIRELGQVTEDMLVLREDPSQNGFQDITEYVRGLKCDPVYGYYRDGWMDESAKVRVMAGASGRIELQCFYPGELDGTETISILSNGREEERVPLHAQTVNLVIQAEPYETVELQFENNFFVRDAEEQRGEKRLSMVVKFVTD